MRFGDKAVSVTMIMAPAIGIIWLNAWLNPPDQALKAGNTPDSGYIVRVEVIHLWVPQSVIDFERSRSAPAISPAHQELQTPAERRTQERLWYGLTKQVHQSDGTVVDVTYSRRPYSEPWRFPEFLGVLAAVARDPPPDPTSEFYGAEIHILHSELSEREPREVLEELLNGSLKIP